jgi:hypothetical protein
LPAVTPLDLDDEILAVLEQAQGSAIFRDWRSVEQNETFHGALLKRIGKTGRANGRSWE